MGTLTGESAASLQAIRRNPIGDATAMPRGSYGQTHGKPYERCLHKCPVYRSGKISAAAFDTKPLPPYNAPLVRANSASAIILLRALCPHPTHSARRRFRRALTRLALFSVSNGVLGVLPCRPRRPVGPRVRMRDGGSNANDSSSYIERDFLGFPQQQKGLGPGRRAGRPRNGASGLLRQPRQHGHVRRVLHPRHGGLHEAADHRDGAVLPPRDRRPGRRLVPDRPGHARVSLHGRFFPP